MIIKNCYDSHLHWQGIGSFKARLNLKNIKSFTDFKNVTVSKDNYRGHWLFAHGLKASFFRNHNTTSVESLSSIYPRTPVYITTPDIHCVYLNQAAIDELKLSINSEPALKPYMQIKNNELTGVFFDLAKDFIDKQLPAYTDQQVQTHLLTGQSVIIGSGVTHIRDLTCSEQQFKQALILQKQGELKIVADLFFKLNEFEKLDEHINKVARLKKQSTDYLKVKGVKIFIDGALGSEGALLSQNYLSGKNGFKLFNDEQIQIIIEKCMDHNLEVAFHTIGDQAAMDVLNVASHTPKLLKNKMHLEHVQLLNDKSIELIKKLGIVCHMQPQHWQSDKLWLKDKINSELLTTQFRWGDLDENQISLYFGSDAPVESMNIGDVIKAIKLSEEEGIKRLTKKPEHFLTYPYESPLKTKTHVDESFKVTKVEF